MDDLTRNLIFKAIDQTITETEFEDLQDAIEHDDNVRDEYLRAIALGESLGEIAADADTSDVPSTDMDSIRANRIRESNRRVTPASTKLGGMVMAATILAVVGGTAFWFGQKNATNATAQMAETEPQSDDDNEPRLIAGHATLRRSVDLRWPDGEAVFRDGDVLPNGRLRFDEGVAEIDFFCGATLIVEGPASLNIQSDWMVDVSAGRLRAMVPPAARGFVVKAADSEIIDLGTEFAVEVGTDNARVEVIDGEVEIRGGDHDGSHLLTGQRQWLSGSDMPQTIDDLSTVDQLTRRQADATAKRFADWKMSSQTLTQDDRLIAYYPIASGRNERVVRNAAGTGSQRDGIVVGPVKQDTSRFGSEASGLEFGRPGSRVRTRIDGHFSALTFSCWVKIDRLEHVYNALFMSDGYETGETHWQICNDGRLMFSVMVDDTRSVQHFSELDQRVVQTAGLAKIYFTEPIWDVSKSGKWFHLAAVYDTASRRVTQYANGNQIASQEIVDKFHIETLQIGPAEIGNWGQPFRKTPWFSVRNLNGTIDELAIFDAALTSEEIDELFESGKPLGY